MDLSQFKHGSYIEAAGPKENFWIAAASENGLIHGAWRCKDFLQDLLWIENTEKEEMKIYGFSHHKQNIKELHLVMQHTNFDVTEKIENINNFLDKISWPVTLTAKAEQGFIIFEATALLHCQPYLASMYTCLIRVAPFYDQAKYPNVLDFLKNLDDILTDQIWLKSDDVEYLTKTIKLLEATFDKNITFQQEWQTFKSNSDCHNNSGFVTFTQQNEEKIQKCLNS